MESRDLPATAGESGIVTGGQALVKFQDDTMMGIAIQRPRVLELVRDKVLAEVNAFPEYADRYFYSIPHRTKQCQHPTSKICPTCEFVEGASIHTALAIQRYWGNSFSSWAPMEETDDHIWLMGTFVDYESNTKFVRPVRAEKGYTTREGEFKPHRGEKLSLAINSAGSKAQRNAILAGVPDALKTLVFTTAKHLIVGEKPDAPLEERHLDAIRVEFAKFGISVDILEAKLGKRVAEWRMKDRAVLLGLRTSLVDGEAKEDIFGPAIKPTQAKPVPVPDLETEPEHETAQAPKPKPKPKPKQKVKPKPNASKQSPPANGGEEDLPLEGTAKPEPSEGDPFTEDFFDEREPGSDG